MARNIRTLTTALTLIAIACRFAHAQVPGQPKDIASFFVGLTGEWVGSVTQATDGKLAETKYFRVSAKQTAPCVYETTFCYYRTDAKTGSAVEAGTSIITTTIDATGTATNCIAGKGDILVDGCNLKPETHALTELLKVSPTGGLQGTASGCISVSGLPLNAGKNGKVQDYLSTWILEGDTLKINQRFKVSFAVLVFRQNHKVVADYTAVRGTDLAGLIRNTQSKAAGPSVCP